MFARYFALFFLKAATMMSSVFAVMVGYGAGNLEMIHGLSMQSGFQGNLQNLCHNLCTYLLLKYF